MIYPSPNCNGATVDVLECCCDLSSSMLVKRPTVVFCLGIPTWYITCCQCTEVCYVYSIQKYITPVTGVRNPLENCSCSESTRRCWGRCVIPLSWCQTVYKGWVIADLMKHLAHNWYLFCCPCTEASLCLLHTKYYPYYWDKNSSMFVKGATDLLPVTHVKDSPQFYFW